MAEPKPKRTPRLLTVRRAGHISPTMIRVTLTADFVSDLPLGAEGANCKIFLPPKGEARAAFEARLETGPRPAVRTFTVRHIRHEDAEMDIDFVDHGDAGPASAWARAAMPGSFLGFAGPSQPKLTEFYADSYLVAADMSAIPVAAATLEAMPRDAKGLALFEITDPGDTQEIDAPEGVEMRWLPHPKPHVASTQVVDIIRDLPPFKGRVQTCIAGESSVIQALRAHLMNDRQLDKKDAYISGYWKIGLVEDEHQQMKRQLSA
ncbi:MAG: siderophore-interacting protein [Pseudomonadota bacterium]